MFSKLAEYFDATFSATTVFINVVYTAEMLILQVKIDKELLYCGSPSHISCEPAHYYQTIIRQFHALDFNFRLSSFDSQTFVLHVHGYWPA